MNPPNEIPEFPPRVSRYHAPHEHKDDAFYKAEGEALRTDTSKRKVFKEPPRLRLALRQNLRRYGLFTPAGIAEAMEASKSLYVPTDPHTIVECGVSVKDGTYARITLDLPLAIAYRCLQAAKARGVSKSRMYTEIITYHVMAIQDSDLSCVPALYADFLSPQGVEVLAKAMRMALDKDGLGRKIAREEYIRQREERKAAMRPPGYRPFSLEKEPEPEPEIDLTPQEREELKDW